MRHADSDQREEVRALHQRALEARSKEPGQRLSWVLVEKTFPFST